MDFMAGRMEKSYARGESILRTGNWPAENYFGGSCFFPAMAPASMATPKIKSTMPQMRSMLMPGRRGEAPPEKPVMTSNAPMSVNMRPIGQRISSPINLVSFRFSGLPENNVQDDTADQQNGGEHGRAQQ